MVIEPWVDGAGQMLPFEHSDVTFLIFLYFDAVDWAAGRALEAFKVYLLLFLVLA